MKLQRRSFITTGITSFIFGTSAGVLNRNSTDTTAEIKLYQTQNLTDYLAEHRSDDWLFSVAEDVIERTLDRDFPRLSHNTEKGAMDVPKSITDPKEQKPGKARRADSLIKWGTYKKENQAENANILFGIKEFESINSNGVSNVAVMPKEVSPVDGFSVIWFNPELSRLALEGIVLHELGHCLGLKHYHGGNVDYGSAEGLRSVMLSRSFSRGNNTNAFGKEVRFTEERARKFNDDLNVSHLTL